MEEEDVKKTATTAQDWLYKYTALLLGLKTVQKRPKRAMNVILLAVRRQYALVNNDYIIVL